MRPKNPSHWDEFTTDLTTLWKPQLSRDTHPKPFVPNGNVWSIANKNVCCCWPMPPSVHTLETTTRAPFHGIVLLWNNCGSTCEPVRTITVRFHTVIRVGVFWVITNGVTMSIVPPVAPWTPNSKRTTIKSVLCSYSERVPSYSWWRACCDGRKGQRFAKAPTTRPETFCSLYIH